MDGVAHPAKRRKLSDATEKAELAIEDASVPATGVAVEEEVIEATADIPIPTTTAPATSSTAVTAMTTTTGQSITQAVSQAVLVDPSSTQPLSKNQLKKLRRKEEWEAGRDSRKAKRREKNQERKVRKRSQKEKEREERKLQGLGPEPVQTKTRPRHVRLPVTFLIDCGFDDKMMEKERISLGAQLTRSYSDNHKAPFQAHMYISSWGGLLKERFDTVLSKHYQNWRGIVLEPGDFVAAAQNAETAMKGPRGGKLVGVFDKYATSGGTSDDLNAPVVSNDANGEAEGADKKQGEHEGAHEQTEAPGSNGIHQSVEEELQTQGEIIYLSSDSPNTLTELKPYSTYIVGGLVDRNRHKGICYQTACDRGIKTAKLPIGQYMEMQSRFVLATNHVVEIMLRWLECGDWGESFMKVIPKRKGGKLRAEQDDYDDDDDLPSRHEDDNVDDDENDLSTTSDIHDDDDDDDGNDREDAVDKDANGHVEDDPIARNGKGND